MGGSQHRLWLMEKRHNILSILPGNEKRYEGKKKQKTKEKVSESLKIPCLTGEGIFLLKLEKIGEDDDCFFKYEDRNTRLQGAHTKKQNKETWHHQRNIKILQ